MPTPRRTSATRTTCGSASENVSDHDVYNAAVEVQERRHAQLHLPAERERLTRPPRSSLRARRSGPTICSSRRSPATSISPTPSWCTRAATSTSTTRRPRIPRSRPDATRRSIPTSTRRASSSTGIRSEGADPYGIFTTPDRQPHFGPTRWVSRTSATGACRAPATRGTDPWYAISPLVDGQPPMRHPLFQESG